MTLREQQAYRRLVKPNPPARPAMKRGTDVNIHTAVLPNGIKVKRTSQNRTYTHVVAAEHMKGTWKDWQTFVPDPEGGTVWVAESWASSEALARKAARQVSGHRLLVVRVLPCTMTKKTLADRVVIRKGRSGSHIRYSVNAAGVLLGKVWSRADGLICVVYNVAHPVEDLVVANVKTGVARILGSHNRAQAEIDQVLAKLGGVQ